MKLKIILIILITISLAIESLSNLIHLCTDRNRFSRIILGIDQEEIWFTMRLDGEPNPALESTPMRSTGGATFFYLPAGYENLLWRNPVTGDFIVGENSLQREGHRSATLFNITSMKLGNVVTSSSSIITYSKYFSVANAGSFAYDPTNNIIYMCSIYENGVFPLTSKSMDRVLFGTRETVPFKGHQLLLNHRASSPILFSDTTIKDFDVSSTHLYIANSFTRELYEIPLTGQNISDSKREILDFMPDSFSYHNSYIYYAHNNRISKTSTVPNSKPEPIF
ncbi:hypothetical protein ACTFIR_010636 [Dictyostelium discoideum]